MRTFSSDSIHELVSHQVRVRGPQWWFPLWQKDSWPTWPAQLLVSALDLNLHSPGGGEEEERATPTSQEASQKLRRWLRSPTDAARLCPFPLQLNITAPTSPALSSSKETWAQRRQRLWMWPVSRNYFISEGLNFTTGNFVL